MLRKIRIKSRLYLSFFAVVLFTLIVGQTGYISLTSIGQSAYKMIHNVTILNEVYDYNASINLGIYNMLYMSDVDLGDYTVQATINHMDGLLARLKEYLDIQEQFSDVFTPGEMQDMANLLELFEEVYIPLLNDIFSLAEQGKRDEALSVSVNRREPLSNSIMYYINAAFNKNLYQSEIIAIKNNENAVINAYLMQAVALFSLVVSTLLGFIVTRSIAIPLSELETMTEKVANGELDMQAGLSKFDYSKSGDEINHLSQRLQETLQQLAQVQQLKLEAIEARHQKEKAESASRSKGEFLAKMSHEIRTPMNAIIGMAELALRDEMPDIARDHVITIKQAGANLLSIINDILDFSKIEKGKLEIIPVNYLFTSLINDVISIIRMKVIDTKVLFTVDIDSNIPNALFGDEIRIRQVLLNLLTNAFKYTNRGFVSLSITGEISGDLANLTMSVSDSGKGIKQEDIGNLFGDFVQVNLTNNRGIEGTGLGLAISKSIALAMGGNISVQSEYGKGSVFTVTIPQKIRVYDKLAAVENPEAIKALVYLQNEIYANSMIKTLGNLGVGARLLPDEADLIRETETGLYSFVFIASELYENLGTQYRKFNSHIKVVLLSEFGETVPDPNLNILSLPFHSISIANILNGKIAGSTYVSYDETSARFIAPGARVLVVDDINTNLKVAEGLLLPYKMQIDLCRSGLQAIQLVKIKKYDIVFMDHMMPEMDGIETTAAIRELEGVNSKNLPIIALTANVVSGMKEMFLEKGFNDLLAKPIDIAKLDEILGYWIPKEKREWHIKSREQAPCEDSADASSFTSPSICSSSLIPGIDVMAGISMTGGTMEGYISVLMLFCEDVEERLSILQKIPSAELLPLFTTQIHALKSASAYIGALDISKIAEDLEIAGKNGDLAFISAKLAVFTGQLSELTKNIKTILERRRPK